MARRRRLSRRVNRARREDDLTPRVCLRVWKRYANAPRLGVVVLQALCAKGRATPPAVLARLFPTSTKSPHLPREIFWRILQFWRTDRDP